MRHLPPRPTLLSPPESVHPSLDPGAFCLASGAHAWQPEPMPGPAFSCRREVAVSHLVLLSRVVRPKCQLYLCVPLGPLSSGDATRLPSRGPQGRAFVLSPEHARPGAGPVLFGLVRSPSVHQSGVLWPQGWKNQGTMGFSQTSRGLVQVTLGAWAHGVCWSNFAL